MESEDKQQVIRICKVSHKKGKTKIEWMVENDKGGWDELTMTCTDMPRQDFFTALHNLQRHVGVICEFPESYDNGITVLGASFTYANDIMGAIITATKKLKYSVTGLNLSTPHKSSRPYSGDNDSGCLDDETVEALEALQAEAEAYLRGDREVQQDLPLEQVEPEDDGPSTAELFENEEDANALD